MNTLTIRLAAPLQAYGDEAAFSRRTSADHPSKSAIIGMLAAALGYSRRDPRIVTLNALAFAVRVDQPGKHFSDFQTVEWKADTRKVTYRDYLQDAVFIVAIGSDDAQLITKLADALHAPKFSLYLGRRSAPPAGPLQIKQWPGSDPVTVLQTQLEWQASEWYMQSKRQADFTAEIFADQALLPDLVARGTLVKDKVLSFDQRDRRFDYRTVAETSVHLVNPLHLATGHDAFGAV